MDAKFQPSFIPKQPIAPVPVAVGGRISLLSVIASVIFIITLGLVGAVLITERSLDRDITALNGTLVAARGSFELSTIAELKKVSGQTSLANNLLNRHIAMSKFLEALGRATYENVSFSSLALHANDPSSPVVISLAGIAASYNSLILQSAYFEDLQFLQSPQFSNFTLQKNGSVGFSFSAIVDPKLVDYKRYIETN